MKHRIKKNIESKASQTKVAKYFWGLIIFWTLILLFLLIQNLATQKKAIYSLAINEARTHFQKDKVFRFWSASHGGFYVPISERTTPSPYLSHIPERDITTPDSVQLTLMNPAWALRQMNEDYSEMYGVFGHITSLLPLRKQNAPDEWEIKALNLFEKGETEFLEFIKSDTQTTLRLMQPLITVESCLKCHGHQGYKIGDVRGGVSVTISLTPYFIEKQKAGTNAKLSFLLIWLIGIIAIILVFRFIKKSILKQEQAKRMLQESHNSLEKSVIERTTELNSAKNFSENLLDTANAFMVTLDKNANITFSPGASPYGAGARIASSQVLSSSGDGIYIDGMVVVVISDAMDLEGLWHGAGELLEAGHPDVNQLAYNLLFRAIEFEIAPMCVEHEISVLCYSPIAQGLLTGKFATPDEVPAGRARTRHFSAERENVRHGEEGAEEETFAAIAEIRAVADELGAPMHHVAMAWLLRRPGVACVLAGMRNREQALDNAAAAELELPDEVVERLNAVTEPLKQKLGPNADMWQGDSRIQ